MKMETFMVRDLYLNKISRFSRKEKGEVNVPICLPIVNPYSNCTVAFKSSNVLGPIHGVDNWIPLYSTSTISF